MHYVLLCKFVLISFIFKEASCLYPFESPTRLKYSLNGLWQFKVDFKNEGLQKAWYKYSFKTQFADSLQIAVPSSFNDLYTNRTIKEHLGWIWYQREFYLNDATLNNIKNYTVVLRLASCHYNCIVWLNGVQLGTHESGHLPFEFEITNLILTSPDDIFNLVIAANNTLTPFTIPPARLVYQNSSMYPPGYVEQKYQMDFYNFAGIHRDVIVYIKPVYNIQDVNLKTNYNSESGEGSVNYQIIHSCPYIPTLNIIVKDSKGIIRGTDDKINGTITIPNVIAWWPRFITTDQPAGYLYTIEIQMKCTDTRGGLFIDLYSFDFGIRSISWRGGYAPQWLINSKPFYCMGANRHEDFPIIGRGIDLALMLKDVSLLQWLNVNCIRTSHYPYAEEFMQLADQLGIAVIDEVPAVGLVYKENFNNITLKLHKNLLNELYKRDKNHPSVIMWSVANEPASNIPESFPYFKEVFNTINLLDSTRPKTFTVSVSLNQDLSANLTDIISINRYYGWYIETGRLDIIALQLSADIQNWYYRYGKPIIVTEYGADALPGTHCFPEQLFCEEFQSTLLNEHHKVFDIFKQKSLLFGELIWNLIDFMTAQDLKRAYGNHKGMFTFERQPKQAAFILKKRYENMQIQPKSSN